MSVVQYSEEYSKIIRILQVFDPLISVKVYEKEMGVPQGSGNVILVRIDSIDYEPLSFNLNFFKVVVKGSIDAIIDNTQKFNDLKDYLIKKMRDHNVSEEVFVPNSIEQAMLYGSHYLTLNFTFFYMKRVED